jgi:hypothetical protein
MGRAMDEKDITPINLQVAPPTGSEVQPFKASATEAARSIQLGVGTIWSACAKLTKQGVDAYQARAARVQAERREALRVQNLQEFQDAKLKVERAARFITPDTIARFTDVEAACQGDDLKLARFLDHELTRKFLARIDQRSAFDADDRQRQQSTYMHAVSTSDFFHSMDQASVDQILKVVSQKYMGSTGGGTFAAGVLASRNNFGGAALVAANVAKVKHRNGMAKAMFTIVIKRLRYEYSGSGMTPEVRRGIAVAYRLLNFREGDEVALNKILFSLVYYNGNATAKPPQPYNEFSASLHPEFHNNFRAYILTVQHALAELDHIVHQSAYRQKLASEQDLSPLFQARQVELPTIDTV